MSLAWHIARKDLLRLRFILLLWAVVITGHVAFATMQSALNPAAALFSYIPALIFGFIFLPAFSLGLPMGVLHDDSLADSDAFWVTRPISGGRLMAAKAIVFVVLAFFPALVTAPWWFASRYDFVQLVAATLSTAWWNASLMLLAVAIASMSRSTGRFIAGACVAGVLFTFLAVFIQPVLAADHVFSSSPLGPHAWPRFMAVSWVVVTIVVLLNQFLRRRARHSLVIAVLGFVLAFAFSLRATTSPSALTSPAPADSPVRLEAVLNPLVGDLSHQHGLTVRVVEAAMDGNRYVMVVTEAAPDFSLPEWMKAPPPPQPVRSESYFLVHRSDGRFVRANVATVDVRLVAATQRHSQRVVVFAAPPDWQRDAAFNFNTWVKGALLVKFSSPTDLAQPPHDLLPVESSPP